MADRFVVEYRGRHFEAVRRSGSQGAMGSSAPVWQISRGGSPVTSFPAEPGETEGAVRDKVVAWLEANEGRPSQDVNRQ